MSRGLEAARARSSSGSVALPSCCSDVQVELSCREIGRAKPGLRAAGCPTYGRRRLLIANLRQLLVPCGLRLGRLLPALRTCYTNYNRACTLLSLV